MRLPEKSGRIRVLHCPAGDGIMKAFIVSQRRPLEGNNRKPRVFRYIAIASTADEAIHAVQVDRETVAGDWWARGFNGPLLLDCYLETEKKS